MKLIDLTVTQLKRAAALKEQIEQLNKELKSILGAPAGSRTASKKSRSVTAAVRKKIAASQKARWAKLRRAKSTTKSVKSSGTT